MGNQKSSSKIIDRVGRSAGLILLRNSFVHIGAYSGYENFIKNLSEKNICYKEVFRRRSLSKFDFRHRFLHAKHDKNKVRNIGSFYNSLSFLAEREAFRLARRHKASVIHNTHLEDNHGFLGDYKKKYLFKLIATAHQPLSWWKYTKKNTGSLQQLDILITLTEADKDYFEKFIPGKVVHVRHGVDVEFFTIQRSIQSRPHRILFVGNWLRDLDFFEDVISRIVKLDNEIFIDIVYPNKKEVDNPIFRLCKHSNVTVHHNLSNEQLLNLYNDSRLLFLPLIDSTANNALLESAACGVPVITTDLNSTREYSSSSYAYYYKSQEDCLSYILDTIKDDQALQIKSIAARNYMAAHFSSIDVAGEHAKIYNQFI